MTRPNFIIVGAAKAGTTSLNHYLGQHPSIFMSDAKEPEYFAYKDVGVDFAGPGDKEAHRRVVVEADAYQGLFAGARSDQVSGEASTIYLYNPGAAKNIRDYNSEMKIIAVLRDPTDRAWSHFVYWMKHLARCGVKDFERYASFRDCVDQEAARIEKNWGPDWHFVNRGRYVAQLSRYYSRFPREHIRVYLYDDFKRDALGVVKDIFRFLGVDDGFKPDVSARLNAAAAKGVLRGKALSRAAMELAHWPAAAPLVRLLPHGMKERVAASVYFKPSFEPKLRREISDGFRAELDDLEGLIGRDLSLWRAP